MSARHPPPAAPKPAGAPAYMLQYSALMSILLSFFIILLTVGQSRTSQFKEGVGRIRNLLGMAGGSGLLEFWRSARRPPLPMVFMETDNPAANLIGYERGVDKGVSLSAPGMDGMEFQDMSRTLRLRSSIRFEPNRLSVSRDSQFALDHAVALLYSLRDYRIVVGVYAGAGNAEADLHLAARRAVWLTRHLMEQAQIPAERIRSMGLTSSLAVSTNDTPPEVVFLLRRVSTNQKGEKIPAIREGADHGGKE